MNNLSASINNNNNKSQVVSLNVGPKKAQNSKWFLFGETKVAQKKRICLKLGLNTVGKSHSNTIHISSIKCSRNHCTLSVTDEEIILRDDSLNGTYINGNVCQKNRQILCDNDLIGFGVPTKPIDFENKSAFVYRVSYQNAFETISLSDDEAENFNSVVVVKQERQQSLLSLCDKKSVIELDDSTDEDSNQDFIGFADNSGYHTDEGNPSSSSSDVSNLSNASSAEALDDLSLGLLDLRTQIKEELVWNTYEFDRDRAPPPDESAQMEIVDLIDDEDDDLIEIQEPPKDRTPRKRNRSETDEQMPYELSNKKVPNDVSPQEPSTSTTTIESPDSTTSDVHSPQVDNNVIETISTVQVNVELLKQTTVKAVELSRSNRLCLDLLGVPYENKATTHKAFHKRTTWRPPGPSSTFVPPSKQQELPLHDIESPHMNNLISEITEWNINWLTEKIDYPDINGMKYEYKPVNADFDSLNTYQSTLKAYLKVELWNVFLQHSKNAKNRKFTFTDLISFKLVNRGLNHERYVLQCEVREKDKLPKPFQPGDFIIATHSRGRFLAFISQVDEEALKKGKQILIIEASKVATNENLTKNTNHLSIVNIVNIRYELEVIDALMKLDKAPLWQAVLSARDNNFLLKTPETRMVQYDGDVEFNAQQLKAFLQIYRRIIHSLSQEIPTIQLLEGGSGTGKTVLVCGLVFQLQKDLEKQLIERKRTLICAPHDRSVDQIARNILMFNKKLVTPRKVVRFSRLNNISDDLHDISVITGGEFSEARVRRCIDEADIICTTLGCCINIFKLSDEKFDVCIVDDATLCSEFTLLLVLRHVSTLILAGDVRLQSPTINSPLSRNNGVARSLLNRMLKSCESSPVAQHMYFVLSTQYRMHPDILSWPNRQFYRNNLTPAAIAYGEFLFKRYIVFDIQTDNECDLMVNVLGLLTKYADPRKNSYGIISAYSDSRMALKEKLSESNLTAVEIGGGDCFQGIEKDIILILATKTKQFETLNRPHNIICAVTRAKKLLVIFGNFKATPSPLWKSLKDDAVQRKLYIQIKKDEKMDEEFLLGKMLKR